jgi:hypothetical protein
LLAHGLDELAGNNAPDQASMYRRKAIGETPNQHYGVVKFLGELMKGWIRGLDLSSYYTRQLLIRSLSGRL